MPSTTTVLTATMMTRRRSRGDTFPEPEESAALAPAKKKQKAEKVSGVSDPGGDIGTGKRVTRTGAASSGVVKKAKTAAVAFEEDDGFMFVRTAKGDAPRLRGAQMQAVVVEKPTPPRPQLLMRERTPTLPLPQPSPMPVSRITKTKAGGKAAKGKKGGKKKVAEDRSAQPQAEPEPIINQEPERPLRVRRGRTIEQQQEEEEYKRLQLQNLNNSKNHQHPQERHVPSLQPPRPQHPHKQSTAIQHSQHSDTGSVFIQPPRHRPYDEYLLKGDRFPKINHYEESMQQAGFRQPSPPPRQTRISSNTTTEAKVVIPMSDTPIIQRNKQFRKDGGGGGDGKKGTSGGGGSRRSSLGLRGRRASSLIDGGLIADPHPELSAESFYKHIDAELLEPRRMKQLLVWCAKRATDIHVQPPPPPVRNKAASGGNAAATSEGNALAIARIIEEEIMKDILEKPELSNWFKRDTKAAPPVVKLPNPRNVDNLAKIQECEETLTRLKEERKAWELMLKAPESGGTLPFPLKLPEPAVDLEKLFSPEPRISQPAPAPSVPPPAAAAGEDTVMSDGGDSTTQSIPQLSPKPPLLTPKETAFVTTTLPSLTTAISGTKEYIDGQIRPVGNATTTTSTAAATATASTPLVQPSKLEMEVDLLASGLHRLREFGQRADGFAGGVLKEVEWELRKRDERVKREVGTEGLGVFEVLRSLSRMET